MQLQILKALDQQTASVELWEEDELLAEVIETSPGERRMFVAEAGRRRGISWTDLAAIAPRMTRLLDEADREMKQTRQALGET